MREGSHLEETSSSKNGSFSITDDLAALMALVMADLSESQRETLMNLIFQRGMDLIALTLEQLQGFVIAPFRAPKSSLENPSYSHSTGSKSFLAPLRGQPDEYKGQRAPDEETGEDPSTFARTSFGSVMRTSATG